MDPNATTLAGAAQQPNVSGALQQLLLSRVHTPDQANTMDQARQSGLEQYQAALRGDPAGTFTPNDQSMGAWVEALGNGQRGFNAVASGIGAGAKFQAAKEAAMASGNVTAAKVGYDDAKDQDNMQERELNALKTGMGSRSQGKIIHFNDDKGNLYLLNNITGEQKVIPASQSPLWTKTYTLAFDQAVKTRNEDPEAYATELANRAVQNSPEAVAPSSIPEQPTRPIQGGSPPGDPELPAVFNMPGARWNGSTLPQKNVAGDIPMDNATRLSDLNAAISDPKTPQNQVPQLMKERDQLASPASKPRTVLTPVDNRVNNQESAYGTEEGKGLFEEKVKMQDLFGANTKLKSQLNMLRHIYQNPDIPEGELGPMMQSMRSSLKSLGVDVDPSVGAADMATAIGTGLALGMKNADGKNLLPGAMSNYEDQLLQKMAPTLGMTQQGRLGMIDFMNAVADSNLRLAIEANKMSKNNTKNKDMLPAEWSARKERILLEEMARLKDRSREIMKQYGGTQ